MWNLDNDTAYEKVYSFELDETFTYGNNTKDKEDKNKRRQLREKVLASFPRDIHKDKFKWWAFRITVIKFSIKPFDIDNVPKILIDAFCTKQIIEDHKLEYPDNPNNIEIKKNREKYAPLGLYEDDTLDYVRLVEIYGQRGDKDITKVEIFGYK